LKKTLSILVLSLLLSANAFSEYYKTGQKISKILEVNKDFKVKLSNSEWIVVRNNKDIWGGIMQRIIGIVRVENNEIMEVVEIYEGLLGSRVMGEIDPIIYEMVFKNNYDGCYEKPEYFLLKFYARGKVHNCMIVRHWDVSKELTNPDDPATRANGALYSRWIKENSIKPPEIMLASEHSYFSRHARGNWFRILYLANPKILNAPITSFKSEETSEYHKFNIEKFPEHKKIMYKWLSISSERHKEFEKYNKAKDSHKLDLSAYYTESKNSKVITVIDTEKVNDDMITNLKKLNNLYKSGILTKEEFTKAKKKLLN
jgi:hypothetical protein